MIPSPPDGLLWTALTVAQEAGGEPRDGKLAVAFVIWNRVREWHRDSATDVIFEPFQFSCWNSDSPTRKRLDVIDPETWRDCYEVAVIARDQSAPDPSNGATHYLNVEVTKRLRGDGTLPRWARNPLNPHELDHHKVTAVIAKHTFLRL